MNIKILKEDKNELELEIDNLTIVELLRAYLNKDDAVSFAAWRKEHFEKPAILKVKTKGKTAKKAISDAIASVIKEAEKLSSELKKGK
jgi:DNA-directed RNA polymerase subunit L